MINDTRRNERKKEYRTEDTQKQLVLDIFRRGTHDSMKGKTQNACRRIQKIVDQARLLFLNCH